LRDRNRLGDLRGGGAADGEGGKPHERELTKVQRGLFNTGGGTSLCSQTAPPFIPTHGVAVFTESLQSSDWVVAWGGRLVRPVIQ
jgi:hypothetical protein